MAKGNVSRSSKSENKKQAPRQGGKEGRIALEAGVLRLSKEQDLWYALANLGVCRQDVEDISMSKDGKYFLIKISPDSPKTLEDMFGE